MSLLGKIEKLRSDHELDSFACGKEDLDPLLKRHAWPSQQANSTQTYVAANGTTVVGYCSLAASAVTHAEATEV